MSRSPSCPPSDPLHAVEAVLADLRCAESFSLAQLWLPTEEESSFRCAVSIPGDRPQDQSFLQYCRSIQMRSSDAVIHRALEAATAIWHEDISRIRESDRSDSIRIAGYIGYCCIPLYVDDTPLAVAEFFDTVPREHDATTLQRIETRLHEALSDIERCRNHFTMLFRDQPHDRELPQHRFDDEELNLLFRRAPLAIVITDENDSIVEANDQFRELFGYANRGSNGESLPQLLKPDTPLVETTPYQDIKAGKLRHVQIEKRYHVDGSPIDVRIHLTGMAIDSGARNKWYCVRMIEDISESRKLQAHLRLAETRRLKELRRFAIGVQNAHEEERRRIASDLHDDLCQRLSGMKLNIEVFEDDVRQADENAFQKLQLLKSQLEGMVDSVRRMSSSLRPSVLDDFGLVAALRVMAREHQDAHSLSITIDAEGYQSNTSIRGCETALYRIAQEALSNIVHHAKATRVHIGLDAHRQEIVMSIQDDGIGFNISDTVYSDGDLHGIGLVSMRERAEHLNGTLRIESSPGAGTAITVHIPNPGGQPNEP